jgi:MoaA/NifB/PqqE/SkfB family radical SAM enzyme
MKSRYERKFTSTKTKLLHNLDRLVEVQSGIYRPVSIQLAPTDKCNLNCIFCSVKNRDMDELTYKEATAAVSDLVRLGAKTVEITGGGDPTLYGPINELLDFCLSLNLRVGLITNGILLNKKIEYQILERLTWIRVSLNGLDCMDDIYLNIPNNVVLGFSYVWNELSSKDKLEKVKSYKEKHNAAYARIVPDCRNVKFIEDYREKIMPLINDIEGMNGIFFQEKEYVPPSRCWMGYLKPFINSDGYVYHCSANPLINLKFNPKFRMGHISEINKIWSDVKPFDSKHCGECFFKEHNELIEELITKVEHKDFI